MDTRAPSIALLLLCTAFAPTTASAEPAADDAWEWTPPTAEAHARAWISASGRPDVTLTVSFPPEQRCYDANLMLTDGAGDVLPGRRITVSADEERFVLAASADDGAGVYEAPPPVFHALKRSRTLRLSTGASEYLFSLAGSAAAINSIWKACEDQLQVSDSGEAIAPDGIGPEAGTDAVAMDAVDAMDKGAPGDAPAPEASVRRRVLPMLVLLFAIGNAFLMLEVLGKSLSLPAFSPAGAASWRRGAAILGAAGWILVPVIVYSAYGVPGAALAVAVYLAAGLVIAAAMQPRVAYFAAGRFVDRLRELRWRGNGSRRGSRLIVEGYRRVSRRQAAAPTDKTTDAEILQLFERVGSAFKSVAYQRGEYLKGPRVNYIVWRFLQVYEDMGREAFDHYLQDELTRYRERGLPAAYRGELKF